MGLSAHIRVGGVVVCCPLGSTLFNFRQHHCLWCFLCYAVSIDYKLYLQYEALSKDRVLFNWGPEHWEAFNVIKKEIVKVPVLEYYDSKKETVLQTDASFKGLGACLIQQGKPVYPASKALSETQKDM